jgi:hypothetical protein
LQQPVESPSRDAVWPIDLQVAGRLETWLPRLQPVIDLAGWNASGGITLDASATVDSRRVKADRVKLSLEQLRAENRQMSMAVDENTVRLETSGTWDLRENRLTTVDTTLTSSTIAFRAQQVVLQLPGEQAAISGTLGYRADLGRLSQTFQPPEATSASRFAGTATGVVRASHEGTVTRLEWSSDIQDFVYAVRSAPSAQPPVRSVSASTPWQETWREASVRLKGQQRYHHASDLLQIEDITAETTTVKLAATGKVEQLRSRAVADLQGSVDYDLAEVTRNLQARLGSHVQLVGRQQGRFQIQGPVFATAAHSAGATVVSRTTPTVSPAPPVSPELTGRLDAGWQSADLYGIEIGAGQLRASLDNCLLRFQPLDLPVSRGRVKASPRIDVSSMPPRLMLDRGPLIENVRISPEMCQTWLKYVAPMLADATRAEGTFSITLDGADVPLPDSTMGTVRGVLTIHSARVGPGPLAQEFLGTAQQIQAMMNGGRTDGGGPGGTWLTLPEQQVKFDVRDGRVQHHGLTMMAGSTVIRTSGSAGFDQSLALLTEVPIQDQWIGNRRLLQGLKGTTVRLPIGGTFSRPRVDQRALADLNKQLMLGAAGGLLGEELGPGLQQLFGPRR